MQYLAVKCLMNETVKIHWGPIAKDLECQTSVQDISLSSPVNEYLYNINQRRNIELI